MSEIVRTRKTDYGINIVYTVRDNQGIALDISTATLVQLRIGRRGETTPYMVKTMNFTTTGVDGQVYVLFGATDLATPGYYDAEILVTYPSGKRNTKPFTIQIIETI